jgi:ribonuclease M5
LIEAFTKAGVSDKLADSDNQAEKITKADLAAVGLSGGNNAASKRRELQKELGLPEHLSANGLLDVLNTLFDKKDFIEKFSESN